MDEEKWICFIAVAIVAAVIYIAYRYECEKEISLWQSLIVRRDPTFQGVRFKNSQQIWEALVQLNDPVLISSYIASHSSDFGESSSHCYRAYNPYMRRSAYHT